MHWRQIGAQLPGTASALQTTCVCHEWWDVLTMHEGRWGDFVLVRTANEDICVAGHDQPNHEHTTYVEDCDPNEGCHECECVLDVWLYETHCGRWLATCQ
jgi:hypothetical protein